MSVGLMMYPFFFFFFKQKTAYEIVSRDWSSDVCSSDLDRKYLLRGLVKCGACGRSYAGGTSTANGKRYHYYNCPRDVPKANGHSCPRVPADWLEALVWGDVRTFLENPGEVLEQVAEQIERE